MRLSKHDLLAAREALELRFLPVAGLLLIIIFICATAGCSPRRTAAPGPAGPAGPAGPEATTRPNIPSPPRREVAILYNNGSGTAEVAMQLRKLLPGETYRLTVADVDDVNSPAILNGLRGRPGLFVVAIGLPAARIARDKLSSPVVFAQVFNYQELLVAGRIVRGVASMPPLDLQVQDWRKLDPKLRRVGLIVSESHTDLIPQAERAAAAASLTIRHEISGSDRETLYLFKRLAPQIDGLWLVPDDRILSPAVLRELLNYAVSHGVRVCVFSDTLLQWGALMSASATPEDTARTLRRVLESMMAGRTNATPAMTPLSEVGIRVNMQVATRLGLPTPPREAWVIRGGTR
jgi:ABC-type uncharacterized transport system substrate-binding protein